MKKLSLLLILSFIVFVSKAQLSQLDLSSYNNTTFDLYLDGALLVNNVSQVSITDITPGSHNLQIKKVNSTNSNASNFLYKPVITIFQGVITIPANTLMTALIYQGQFFIQNQTALAPIYPANGQYVGNPYQNNYPPNGNYYDHVNPYAGQVNTYAPPGYIPGMNSHWNVQAPQQVCDHYAQPVYIPGPQAMSSESFQQLKASINNQWFSSGQMAVFNQALASNYFTSSQVRELVQGFTFSSDQLVVAKKAYTKTIDPQNYFVVNDALEFSSSVSALSAYIASL